MKITFRKTTSVLLFLFLSLYASAQEVLVKNLQGQDVSMTSILQQSEKDQPTILITWANSYCGVCKTIIDELQNQYAPLKEKYNLRVITLNTDSNKDEMFKKHYDSRYKDDMGAFTSITDFVRNYKGIKNWEFEKYVDEDFNFFESAGLKGAPVTYIFYNNELKFYKYGFWVPKEAKNSDGSAKLQMTTSENTVNNLKRILESMYANEAYFDANWHYTLEEDQPTYKRTTLKIGNLYEITDTWITGEMQMRGTFKDNMATIYEGKTTFYYKNGNKEYTRNFIDNVLNGPSVEYYENGKVNWKGSYKNGEYDGKWEGFYDNEKPMTEKFWSEGKLLKINYFNDADGQSLLQNGTGIYKEYYQSKVVKSIQKYREHQKHGEWKYYYENGKLSAIVNYEDDKAHGSYKTYHKNGKVKTKGNYWEGKKDSVWTYYDEEGKETKSELWERGLKSDLEAKKDVEKIETLPTFKGGKQALSSYLSQNMNYPETAKKLGIQGKVFVEFVISKDGSIKNVKLLKGVQNDLDNEAIRLIKNMPNWVPGEIRGEKVSIKQVIPINFSLQ